MSNEKYSCPQCNGIVEYGSRFCPHCRYEFGTWEESNTSTDSASKENLRENKSGSKSWIKYVAGILLAVGAYNFFFSTPSTPDEAALEAIEDGSIKPIEEYYQSLPNDKRYENMGLVSVALMYSLRYMNDTDATYKKVYNILQELDIKKYPDMVLLQPLEQRLHHQIAAFDFISHEADKFNGGDKSLRKSFIANPYSSVTLLDGYVLKRDNGAYLFTDYHSEWNYWGNITIPDISKIIYTVSDVGLHINEQGVKKLRAKSAGYRTITTIEGFTYEVPHYKVISKADDEAMSDVQNLSKDYKEDLATSEEFSKLIGTTLLSAVVYKDKNPAVLSLDDDINIYTNRGDLLSKYGDKVDSTSNYLSYVVPGMILDYRYKLPEIITQVQVYEYVYKKHKAKNTLDMVPSSSTLDELIKRLKQDGYLYTIHKGDYITTISVLSPDNSNWDYNFIDGRLSSITNGAEYYTEKYLEIDEIKKYEKPAQEFTGEFIERIKSEKFSKKVKDAVK